MKDPTRLLLPTATALYDFMLTRNWKAVAVVGLPIWCVTCLVCFVALGGGQSRHGLAMWYASLAEREVSDWEDEVLAGDAEDSSAQDEQTEEDASQDSEKDDQGETEQNPETTKISRYASMLFKRVQELSPTERSQYFVAYEMLEAGYKDEALKLMMEIAPNDTAGYTLAHCYVAEVLMMQLSEQNLQDQLPLVRHHVENGLRGDLVPKKFLQVAANFYWATAKFRRTEGQIAADKSKAVRLMQGAANRIKPLHLQVVRWSKEIGNMIIMDESLKKATEYFQGELNRDPQDDFARIAYAECLSHADATDQAETVLRDGLQRTDSPKIKRMLSDFYRVRYRESLSKASKSLSESNLRWLDKAFNADPSNPGIGEDIAQLIRFSGPTPSPELINNLEKLLAKGTATALTHRWLSEAYLVKGDLEAAEPHLRQVVTRLPAEHQARNNLAFVLNEIHPEKKQEALGYVMQAINITNQMGRPNPDYFDTFGVILVKQNDLDRAVTAFETAVNLAPKRIDIREHLADAYRQIGNESMVKNHESIIAELKQSREGQLDNVQTEVNQSTNRFPDAKSTFSIGDLQIENSNSSSGRVEDENASDSDKPSEAGTQDDGKSQSGQDASRPSGASQDSNSEQSDEKVEGSSSESTDANGSTNP
ncbi:MAG: hypothetical protein AAF483_24950 [Planctomycetota bacterium]